MKEILCMIEDAQYMRAPRGDIDFSSNVAEIEQINLLMNEKIITNKELSDKESFDEGIFLILFDVENPSQKYYRFMDISLIELFLSQLGVKNIPQINENNLIFFAEQLKKRESPLKLGLFDKGVDIVDIEYNMEAN